MYFYPPIFNDIDNPQNGDILTYDAATGLWVNAPEDGVVDTFIDVVPRMSAGSTMTMTSGRVQLVFFTPTRNLTVSQLSMAVAGTAGSGLTVARMGLYTWDGSTATLVAQTANNTAMFSSTFTVSTNLFSTADGFPATYDLVAGQRYAVSVIVVGTTPPSLVAGFTGAPVALLEPRTLGRKNSQADLPATITSFDTGETSNIFARVS